VPGVVLLSPNANNFMLFALLFSSTPSSTNETLYSLTLLSYIAPYLPCRRHAELACSCIKYNREPFVLLGGPYPPPRFNSSRPRYRQARAKRHHQHARRADPRASSCHAHSCIFCSCLRYLNICDSCEMFNLQMNMPTNGKTND
jgi:hypothetical protein